MAIFNCFLLDYQRVLPGVSLHINFDTAKFPNHLLSQAENEKKELLLQKFAEAADEVGGTIRMVGFLGNHPKSSISVLFG